eukprot:PLAT15863.1.p1 GENE.PLAT15863.1~~PLAT15863.1.p1  ORF type:complete len:245 (-),score=96.70 PLAT15863.1:84-791(-)
MLRSAAALPARAASRAASTLASLRLGDVAPDFTQDSTDGEINFHEYIEGKWAILMSHPADYTPVCTTELGAFSARKEEFAARNVVLLALSTDGVESHAGWIEDIKDTQDVPSLGFPILGDEDHKVSELYGMLDQTQRRLDGLPQTVRSLFVIGPDKTIKLSLTYPASTGRDVDEVLRVVDSLQLTAEKKLATPVGWRAGDDAVIIPAVSDEEAKELFPKGWRTVRPYLRFTSSDV